MGRRFREELKAPIQWGRVLAAQAFGYVRMPLLVALCFWLLGSNRWRQLSASWNNYGLSERWAFVIGTVVLHEVLYIGMNTFFLLCDVYVCGSDVVQRGRRRVTNVIEALSFRYGWLAEYKLPRANHQKLDRALLRDTLLQALIGHLLIQVSCLLAWYAVARLWFTRVHVCPCVATLSTQPVALYFTWDLFEHFGSTVYGPLPAWHTVVWELVLSGIFLDVLFYATHRLLHTKWLYKHVHHQHHLYVGSIGFTAEYAHWCVGDVAVAPPPP